MGSSPRLRGTQVDFGADFYDLLGEAGIIPALAGNTSHRSNTTARGRDHPRACGEHFSATICSHWLEGSSPRLRGTPARGLGCRVAAGIIPALAGNTASSSSNWRFWAGSSPRLRGTHFGECLHGLVVGIIPALAGNTAAEIAYHDHP